MRDKKDVFDGWSGRDQVALAHQRMTTATSTRPPKLPDTDENASRVPPTGPAVGGEASAGRGRAVTRAEDAAVQARAFAVRAPRWPWGPAAQSSRGAHHPPCARRRTSSPAAPSTTPARGHRRRGHASSRTERGPSEQGRRSPSTMSLGGSASSSRRGLEIYDPDRSKTVLARGQIAGGASRRELAKAALGTAPQGEGLRIPRRVPRPRSRPCATAEQSRRRSGTGTRPCPPPRRRGLLSFEHPPGRRPSRPRIRRGAAPRPARADGWSRSTPTVREQRGAPAPRA